MGAPADGALLAAHARPRLSGGRGAPVEAGDRGAAARGHPASTPTYLSLF